MTKIDKLFELIHSLDKKEKSWVVKCLKAFQQKNNLKLFELFAKRTTYNKREIEKLLKKEPFFKYLSVQKNNLYQTILKYLRLYLDDKGGQHQMDFSLINLVILQKKGLYDHIMPKIGKMQKKAKQQQQHYQLLKFISIQRDILAIGKYKASTIKELEDINIAFENRLHLLSEVWNYRYWTARISKFISYTKSAPSKEREQRLVEEFNIFIKQNNTSKNIIALYYYYQVYVLFYIYKQDYKNAFFYIKKQLASLDAIDIDTHGARQNKAITFINSVTIAFLANEDTTIINDLIERTHKLIQVEYYKPIQNRLYNELYYNQLNYYNYRGLLEDSNILINTIIKKREQTAFKFLLEVRLSIAVYYFIQADYDQAILWNNQLLTYPRKNLSEQLYYNALILRLLTHIECDNLFYVESLLKTLINVTNSKKEKSPFIQLVLGLFKALIKELGTPFPKIGDVCASYEHQFDTYFLDDIKYLPFLNLRIWVKSKSAKLSLKKALLASKNF